MRLINLDLLFVLCESDYKTRSVHVFLAENRNFHQDRETVPEINSLQPERELGHLCLCQPVLEVEHQILVNEF